MNPRLESVWGSCYDRLMFGINASSIEEAPELLVPLKSWSDPKDLTKSQDTPPEHVEYEATGQMRADILAAADMDTDDPVRVTTTKYTEGYSEYTIEYRYSIECYLPAGELGKWILWTDSGYSTDRVLGEFMRWIDQTETSNG